MANQNYKCEDGVISIKIGGKWIIPTFERYEDIEPIGEPGANGVVVKATHRITQRKDAIKIWLPRERNGKNEIREEQYKAEIRKIAKLNDPRIATIHDAWNENGCYCCSMEYIDGDTYEKWLKKNTNIRKRVEILSRIFDAIVFYQSQGIIHGDIHMKNILIDSEEKVHIIDFGTSSLSAYVEQSIHRENYLMYELVERTIDDQFDERVFIYKKYLIKGEVVHKDDVRNVIPIFFSKSVLSYLHLLEILMDCEDIINSPDVLYDYCRTIAKGYYLNLDYFYQKISGKNNRKLDIFSNVMYESIEDEIYEDVQDNIDEADSVKYLSLFVYYNQVKEWLKVGNITREEIIDAFSNDMFDDSEKIINIFMGASDLLEFHEGILNVGIETEDASYVKTDVRSILYRIIEEKSGEYLLHVLREMYLKMSELRMNDEMYGKIIRLTAYEYFAV